MLPFDVKQHLKHVNKGLFDTVSNCKYILTARRTVTAQGGYFTLINWVFLSAHPIVVPHHSQHLQTKPIPYTPIHPNPPKSTNFYSVSLFDTFTITPILPLYYSILIPISFHHIIHSISHTTTITHQITNPITTLFLITHNTA